MNFGIHASSSIADVSSLGTYSHILAWHFHSNAMKSRPARGVVTEVVLPGKVGTNAFNDGTDGVGLLKIHHATAGKGGEGLHGWLVDQAACTDGYEVKHDASPTATTTEARPASGMCLWPLNGLA